MSPRFHARLLRYLGRSQEHLLDKFLNARPSQAAKAVVLASMGRLSEAKEIRDRYVGIESNEDETAWTILVALLEESVSVEDEVTARALMPRLEQLAIKLSTEQSLSVGRLLGAASTLLGSYAAARDFYGQALDVSERVRFRPEVALTRAHLAELLLDHYPDERDAAIKHLDFAITEFREMKMQPALERALGRRGLLKA
jgi:tetratricopeptide (TPR) repeat protein